MGMVKNGDRGRSIGAQRIRAAKTERPETSEVNDFPAGCGSIRNRTLESVVVGRVDITYHCTACGNTETVSVRWRSHHAMPRGWTCRDIIPTFELPRRSDHIFACSKDCRKELDARFPPPKTPKWFTSS